jgi:hypothetical protein
MVELVDQGRAPADVYVVWLPEQVQGLRRFQEGRQVEMAASPRSRKMYTRKDPLVAGGKAAKKKSSGSWSSGNKTGKTAAQMAKERKRAESRGSEGPKRSMPRPGGVGKGSGRGTAANKRVSGAEGPKRSAPVKWRTKKSGK